MKSCANLEFLVLEYVLVNNNAVEHCEHLQELYSSKVVGADLVGRSLGRVRASGGTGLAIGCMFAIKSKISNKDLPSRRALNT
jgi:hypothetical protein